MKILLLILLIGSIIVFLPLLTIWALNTLFNLGIVYTLETWAASFILGGIFYQSNNSNK